MKDISLIELSKQDIELVRAWRNSQDVSKFMYDESYISEEQQQRWYDRISAETNSVYWLIEYEGKKLGVASLTGIDYILNSCYWAFYLGDFSVRGAGIGARVEYNVMEYVFNILDLNKLRCEVFVSNHQVIKMHEKFGFRREAYYREHCVKGGEKMDVVGLAILKSDWLVYRDILKVRIYG